MPAINTIKGIAPGKIFYHVYGSVITKGKHDENKEIDEYIGKLIVTSFPKYWHSVTNTLSDSLFFDVLLESSFRDDMWKSCHSVRDCGINCTHGKYNLNRIFATKYEAREFVSQCLMGKFFDKEDQEVYDRSKCDYDEGLYFTPNYF